MRMPISPVFLKALAIDLAIIFAALSIVTYAFNVQLMDFVLPVLLAYAVIHSLLEAVGIG